MTDDGLIAAGRSVSARNIGVDEQRAEAMMTERAGREYTLEAFAAMATVRRSAPSGEGARHGG